MNLSQLSEKTQNDLICLLDSHFVDDAVIDLACQIIVDNVKLFHERQEVK